MAEREYKAGSLTEHGAPLAHLPTITLEETRHRFGPWPNPEELRPGVPRTADNSPKHSGLTKTPFGKSLISKDPEPRGVGLENPPTPPNKDLSIFS